MTGSVGSVSLDKRTVALLKGSKSYFQKLINFLNQFLFFEG